MESGRLGSPGGDCYRLWGFMKQISLEVQDYLVAEPTQLKQICSSKWIIFPGRLAKNIFEITSKKTTTLCPFFPSHHDSPDSFLSQHGAIGRPALIHGHLR